MTIQRFISAEDFQRGYDINFIKYIKEDYNKNSYIPWHALELLCNKHFPQIIRLSQEVEYLYVDNHNVATKETKIQEYQYTVVDGKQVKQLVRDDSGTETNPAETTRKLIGANILTTLFNTDNQTTSEVQSYPIMAKNGKMSGLVDLDARAINDSKQRAYARALAVTTGVGLRLWTREGLDASFAGGNGKPQQHILMTELTKLHRMQEYYAVTIGLPEDYVEPNFGMSLKKLKEYDWLAEAMKQNK